MKRRYLIEVICSGHTARSPIAEVLGNTYIEKKGLIDSIRVTSSGTRVNADLDFERVYKFISIAYNFPLYEIYQDDKLFVEEILTDKDCAQRRFISDVSYMDKLKTLSLRGANFLMETEAKFRDATLARIGLRYDGKRTQTEYNPEVSLVLGMDKRHRDFAKTLYLTHSDVVVDTLPNYAGFTDREVRDCFGSSDIATYDELRESLESCMTSAINRFISQLKGK